MEEIRNWLKGNRNYEEGARLYLIHGKNNALRRSFSEPESAFKKDKLIEALKELLEGKKAIVQKIAVTKEAAIKHISVSYRKWPDDKDETLKALHEKWKPLFAELMSLTSRIYDVALAGEKDITKKQEAGRMAHRICDLDDQCDAIYEQRDFYLEHNRLPDEKKPMELVIDPIKIPLALSNARRYVSEYRSKLKKQPDNVKFAEKLKKYEWAVSEYMKILKID